MSQFEEIPSPGRDFQGSRALGGLAACKTLGIPKPAARQCGPFGGSAIPGVKPVRGNSPPAIAARDLGSRPPIVADVGGLEPSVPLVLLLVGESLGR